MVKIGSNFVDLVNQTKHYYGLNIVTIATD